MPKITVNDEELVIILNGLCLLRSAEIARDPLRVSSGPAQLARKIVAEYGVQQPPNPPAADPSHDDSVGTGSCKEDRAETKGT